MQQSNKHGIRKLSKVASGKSYAVTIPVEVVRHLGWREKQNVSVKLVRGAVVIRDARSRKKTSRSIKRK